MEIKRNIWIKRFTLVFRLFLIVFGFGIWNYIIDSYAKEEKVSNNDELYVESNEKNLFLETENLEFLDNFVNLEIISNKKISEVSIINDYDLNIEAQDFKFIVSFYCEENVEDEIKFKIIYDDLTYNFYELYFVSNQYGVFMSDTTIRNTYTFSEFINNFYDKYPSYKTKLGDNISQYNFAANEVSISESELSFDNPPIINISNNGGSIVFPNDSYTLYFYDSYNLVYLKIDSITTNQFQIPIKEWHKICKNSDSIVSFRIGCNQNEIPKTGEYLSKLFSFKKPDFNYLTDDFYVTNDLNYKEFSYSPMGGQKVLINLTFENSNRYIIQTFGRVFTSITIFDENMNELLFDKYSGFENNALINYYFEKNAEYNLLITTSSYVRYSILRTNSLVTDFDNIDKKYGEEYPGTYNSQMTGKTEILRFGVEFTNGYNFEVIADFDSIIYLIDPSDYRILGEYYSTSVENDNQSDSINAKAYTNIFDEEEILIIICSKTEVENENYILNIY